MSRIFVTSIVVLLAACRSEPGEAGPQGATGPAGMIGPQGPAGEAGPVGPQGPPGQVLVLDGGVVTGPAGPQGASVVMTVLAPSTQCPAGGVRLTLEDGGSPQLVCNGTAGTAGTPGAAGPAGAQGTSVTLSAIDGGACPYGGARLSVDGGAPVFVCNGAPGAAGAAGATGPAGATGAPGAAGPAGPTGTPGASVTVTSLAAGDATCPYGGSRFTVGASSTTACNGAPGAMGPPGSGSGGGSGATPGAFAGNEGFSLAGVTAAAYTGALGGLQGAHAKCAAEFTGAHLCTWREYELIGSSSPVPVGGAWIDGARYLSTSAPDVTARDRDSSYTCNNWNSATGSYSAWIDTYGEYMNSTTAGSCGGTRPLLCCRAPQTAWFRGFTTATANGDLGGIRGAHGRCAAQYAGAHLCTWREYEQAGSAAPVPASGAWIDGARYLSSSAPSVTPRDRDSSYTCNNWRSGTAPYSAWINPLGEYMNSTTANSCATLRPLACCSN